MNSKTFNVQMERLRRVFGERHYPMERKDIFWEMVKDMPDEWMVDTVHYFIANWQLHIPPLGRDFQERITSARDRGWELEKDGNTAFFTGGLPDFHDKASELAKAIGDDIKTGANPKAKVESILKLLKPMPKE